jgi:hypothetical protein
MECLIHCYYVNDARVSMEQLADPQPLKLLLSGNNNNDDDVDDCNSNNDVIIKMKIVDNDDDSNINNANDSVKSDLVTLDALLRFAHQCYHDRSDTHHVIDVLPEMFMNAAEEKLGNLCTPKVKELLKQMLRPLSDSNHGPVVAMLSWSTAQSFVDMFNNPNGYAKVMRDCFDVLVKIL